MDRSNRDWVRTTCTATFSKWTIDSWSRYNNIITQTSKLLRDEELSPNLLTRLFCGYHLKYHGWINTTTNQVLTFECSKVTPGIQYHSKLWWKVNKLYKYHRLIHFVVINFILEIEVHLYVKQLLISPESIVLDNLASAQCFTFILSKFVNNINTQQQRCPATKVL